MRSPTLFPCIPFDSLPSFLSLYCFKIFGHNLCMNYLFVFFKEICISPSAAAFILTKERKFNLIFTLHIKMQIKFSLISSFSWKSCQRNWASWWKSLLLGLCLQSFDKQIMRLPRSLNLFFPCCHPFSFVATFPFNLSRIWHCGILFSLWLSPKTSEALRQFVIVKWGEIARLEFGV